MNEEKESEKITAKEVEFQILFHVKTVLEDDETPESLPETIKKELRSIEAALEKHPYVDVANGEFCFASEGEFDFEPKEGTLVNDGSSLQNCTCGGFYRTTEIPTCYRCGAKVK